MGDLTNFGRFKGPTPILHDLTSDNGYRVATPVLFDNVWILWKWPDHIATSAPSGNVSSSETMRGVSAKFPCAIRDHRPMPLQAPIYTDHPLYPAPCGSPVNMDLDLAPA